MLGYLFATSGTMEVLVQRSVTEEGKSRCRLPVDVHVLLTDRGRLPLIGYPDTAEVYAGIRPGQRYRMRIARWPWGRDRMVIEIRP